MKQTKREIKIISLYDTGDTCAIRLANALIAAGESAEVFAGATAARLKTYISKQFNSENLLLFVGSCDATVRAIAPLIKNKTSDPPVIVTDDKCENIIPILMGKGNDVNTYARTIAELMHSRAALTISTDPRRLPEIDVFARRNGLMVTDTRRAREFTTSFYSTRQARLMMPAEIRKAVTFSGQLPDEFEILTVTKTGVVRRGERKRSTRLEDRIEMRQQEEAAQENQPSKTTSCIISPYRGKYKILQLVPRCIVIGIDCPPSATADEVEEAVQLMIGKAHLFHESLAALAVAKSSKEPEGAQEAAERFSLTLDICTAAKKKTAEENGAEEPSYEKAERIALGAGAISILAGRTCANGISVAAGVREIVLYP